MRHRDGYSHRDIELIDTSPVSHFHFATRLDSSLHTYLAPFDSPIPLVSSIASKQPKLQAFASSALVSSKGCGGPGFR